MEGLNWAGDFKMCLLTLPSTPQFVSKTSSIMIELVFVTFLVTNGRAEGALVEPKRRRVAVRASLRLPQHFPW